MGESLIRSSLRDAAGPAPCSVPAPLDLFTSAPAAPTVVAAASPAVAVVAVVAAVVVAAVVVAAEVVAAEVVAAVGWPRDHRTRGNRG